MNLKKIKNNILRIQNKLEYYLTKKKINFEKTQPGSSKIKEVVVFSGFNIFDAFSSYMIKDEEIDEYIYPLQEELLNEQLLFIKEVNRMRKYDQLPLIVYLREEENWSWKKIDKFLCVSDDVSRVRYSRYRGKKVN